MTCRVMPERGIGLHLRRGRAPASESRPPRCCRVLAERGAGCAGVARARAARSKGKSEAAPMAAPVSSITGLPLGALADRVPSLAGSHSLNVAVVPWIFLLPSALPSCLLQPRRTLGPADPYRCCGESPPALPLPPARRSRQRRGLSQTRCGVLPVAPVPREHQAPDGSSSHCL